MSLKVELDRDDLLKALRALSATVPRRPTLPQLQFIRASAVGDRLTFTADNLDVRLSIRVPATVHAEGDLWFPHRSVMDLTRAMPRLPVTIEGDGLETAALAVGRARYEVEALVLAQGEEKKWPTDFEWAADFPAGWFGLAARRGLAFASSEQTRPILNGVFVQLLGDSARVVSTNGHRMVVADRAGVEQAPAGGVPAGVILPPDAIRSYIAAAGGADTVELEMMGTGASQHVRMRWARCEMVCLAIEGPYPNFQQVIPAETSRTLTVSVADLSGAVRRAKVLSDRFSHRVALDLAPGGVVVSARAEPCTAREQIDAEFEGEPLRIGFNAEYLLGTLREVGTAEARIRFVASERAALVEPVGENVPGGEKLLYLLMPLRLFEEIPHRAAA